MTLGETLRQEGREEGREEGRKESMYLVTIRMSKQGFSFEVISQVTGFSVEEVMQIIENSK